MILFALGCVALAGLVWWLHWRATRPSISRTQIIRQLLRSPVLPPRVIFPVSDGREKLTQWQLRKARQQAGRRA